MAGIKDLDTLDFTLYGKQLSDIITFYGTKEGWTQQEINTAISDYRNDFVSFCNDYNLASVDNSTPASEIEEIVNNILSSQDYASSSDIESLSSNVDTVKESVDSISSEMESVKNDIDTVTSDVDALSTFVETAETNIALVSSDVESVKSEVKEVKENIATVTSDVETLSSSVDSVKEDINVINNSIDEVSSDIDDIKTNITNITDNVEEAQGLITTAQDDIKKINETIETLTGTDSKTLDAINTLKEALTLNDGNTNKALEDIATNASLIKGIESDVKTLKGIDHSLYAQKTDIPTKVSELTNDADFVVATELVDYAKTTDVPTKVAQLEDANLYALKSEAYDGSMDVKYVSAPYTNKYGVKLPERKTIFLNNHDNICGFANTDDQGVDNVDSVKSGAYNLAMVSFWNVVDLGNTAMKMNLNAKDGNVTINENDKVATENFVTTKISKISIPTVPTKVSAFENDAEYLTKETFTQTEADKLYVSLKDNGLATEEFVTDEVAKVVVPTKVSELSDASNYVLKSVYDKKVNELESKIDKLTELVYALVPSGKTLTQNLEVYKDDTIEEQVLSSTKSMTLINTDLTKTDEIVSGNELVLENVKK